jgi:prevent-host-death family protein
MTIVTIMNITTMNLPKPGGVSAADFKARCLDLMDQVQLKKTEIIVTKYGKPVAKMVPLNDESPDLFGWLGHSVTYHGDIVGPTGETWDADA